MNIVENVKEGIRSIKSNLLRTVLTAAIIAIGIAALVAILTAIDGLQASINDSFTSLGANSFEIRSKGESGRRRSRGKEAKVYPPLEYKDMVAYKKLFDYSGAIVGISNFASGQAEVKKGSKKTNPNTRVYGGDENFIFLQGYELKEGRGFSNTEVQYATNVAIIGSEIASFLFEKEEPINNEFAMYGRRYKVIGVLDQQGGMSGDSGADRMVVVPVENATRIAPNRVWFSVDTYIENPTEIEFAMGEATGLMRSIRQDPIGREESFEVRRNNSASEKLDEISGYFKIGGGVIGFITLLGAAVALMNIMMVSVTERTREIGVRKALGATPLRIRQQFLIEAIVICLLGGIAGVLLGLILGNLSASALGGSFVVPWGWTMMGLIVCVAVGLISGYFPAYKASKLDPIESLRFE